MKKNELKLKPKDSVTLQLVGDYYQTLNGKIKIR